MQGIWAETVGRHPLDKSAAGLVHDHGVWIFPAPNDSSHGVLWISPGLLDRPRLDVPPVGDVIAEAVSEGRLRADGSVLYATGRLSPGVWFDVITESLCGEGRDLRSPEMH